MTLRAVVAVVISTGGGCGPAPTKPTPPVATVAAPALPPDMTGSFAPVGWLLGDWHAADGGDAVQHWVAAEGTLYGVRFAGGAWGVMIIDDGDGKADKADGIRRHIDLGDGHLALEQHEVKAEDGYVRYEVGTEVGIGIEYRLDLEQLVVTESIGRERREEHGSELVGRSGKPMQPDPARYKRTSDEPAPELEAADRAFDADTAAEGVAGWVKWFAPDGALWRDERFEGRDAIGRKLEGTLSGGALRWQPIASRMLATDLGFTVGTATWTGKGDAAPSWRGSYVTIWRKQPDASWKVAFDTGRTAQPTM